MNGNNFFFVYVTFLPFFSLPNSDLSYVKIMNYSQTPMQRHPYSASVKVCEEKFRIINCFALSPKIAVNREWRCVWAWDYVTF
jgi:hypothetical protein